LEGRSDPEAWAAHRQVMEAWTIHHNLQARAPGGESFVDVRNRFVPFVEGLISGSVGGADGQTVVLVGHGALLVMMLPLVAPNLTADFVRTHPLPHARPVVVEARPGHVVCLEWAGAPVPALGADDTAGYQRPSFDQED
jgi:broad specificity phosphatase PhoE